MRFMMFMIPKVYQPDIPASERPGENFAPPADAVEKMMRFNEELTKAGALISLDGLHPASKGARVAFTRNKPSVIEGAFSGAKEVIGGYWIIDAKSKQEAVEWARRVPAEEGDVIEVRQIFEMSEFPADVKKAADSPAVRAQVAKQTASKYSRTSR